MDKIPSCNEKEKSNKKKQCGYNVIMSLNNNVNCQKLLSKIVSQVPTGVTTTNNYFYGYS